jgi:hypothetical protein
MSAVDAIREARKHLGYVEGPKKNNIFGAWYGANYSPWCAAFVSYVLNHTKQGDLIKGAQTAKGFNSCGKGIAFFKKNKAWFKVEDAKPGDLAFFDWDHDGEQDHVGIVSRVDLKKKLILCIEGNTSDSSHSNGGVVKEQWRNMSVIMGVGRPAYKKASVTKRVVAAVTKPAAPAKPKETPVA